MSESIPLFVQASYDRMIEAHLEAGSRLAELFPLSEETRERWLLAEQAENERRVSVMRDHLTVPGTTDVCQCGEVCMSTSGYLLHLYEVVEDDHVKHSGCDER